MPAPWFNGTDQTGKEINLNTFEGKCLLLYFYPKNNTPPCTNQACSTRDGYTSLQNANIEVVGVSADDQLSQSIFATQYELPYSLIADTSLKIIKAYNVWGLKNIAGRQFEGIVRTSFIIGKDKLIKNVILQPKTMKHGQQVLDLKV